MGIQKASKEFEKFVKSVEAEALKFYPQEKAWQQFFDETFEFEKKINLFAERIKMLGMFPEWKLNNSAIIEGLKIMERGIIYMNSSHRFLVVIKELMLARNEMLTSWNREIKSFALHNIKKHLEVLKKMKLKYDTVSKLLLQEIEEKQIYLISEATELNKYYATSVN